MNRFLLISSLFVFISFPVSAQQSDEKPVTVPEDAMEQVVRRIVTWYFKPRTKSKTIYLSNSGIKAEWLPNIRNIKFVLVEPNSPEADYPGVYFFKDVRLDTGVYSVDFGFGEPTCDATGDTWSFRWEGSRVRLYQNGNWGSACGSDS
jgi:hypothetical protein